MVKNVLFPVRSDRDIQWVIDFMIRLHQREPVRIHLLSVQTPFDGHVRMFFKDDEIRRIQREDGEAELQPVREALDRAGVPYVCHIGVGFSAATIAEFARQYDCRQIVMGPPRSQGAVSQLLLGSIGRQVEHLLQVAGQPCEVL